MEFTKEMAEQLYLAVTGDALDCKLQGRWYNRKTEYHYDITWVYKDTDNKGNTRYWEFMVSVPMRDPESFEVRGHSSNPQYKKDTSLRVSRKEEARQKVSKELYRILRRSEEWQQEQQDLYDEYAELHGGEK
jgi:hypothetical protein